MEIEMYWYEKLIMHVSAVLGLLFSPITYPISIGAAIWANNKFGKHAGKMAWMMILISIKFQFTHNVKKYMMDCEYYYGRYIEAVKAAL